MDFRLAVSSRSLSAEFPKREIGTAAKLNLYVSTFTCYRCLFLLFAPNPLSAVGAARIDISQGGGKDELDAMNVAMSAAPASYTCEECFSFYSLLTATQGRNTQSTLHTRNSLKIKPHEKQRAERPGASSYAEFSTLPSSFQPLASRTAKLPDASIFSLDTHCGDQRPRGQESVRQLTSHHSPITTHQLPASVAFGSLVHPEPSRRATSHYRKAPENSILRRSMGRDPAMIQRRGLAR